MMGKSKRTPRILVIDDREEGVGSLKLALERRKRTKVSVLHPQEVELDDLRAADLVLVDYVLDAWPERDDVQCISLQPPDGLALASVFRRRVHVEEDTSPTAFAIHTGQLPRLAAPLPPDHREHVLARMNNLEWVFRKEGDGELLLADQVVSLAQAVVTLPKHWPTRDAGARLAQLATLLSVPKAEDVRSRILEGIENCMPPIHELSEWSHGLSVLRWMLHRILPYPCFLWDSFYLAARLRVDHRELQSAMAEGNPLRKKLRPAEYRGILATFAGLRWWRPAVEHLLWRETDGKSFDVRSVHGALNRITGRSLKASTPREHPVVCVDQHYRAVELAAIEEAVHIRPDWPSYADQAWTTPERVQEEPALKALIVSDSQHEAEGRG